MKRPSRSTLGFRSLLCLAIGVAATQLPGCGSAPSGPKLDPAGFPRAIQSLHNLAGEVIQAFAGGNPADADRPLHNVGKTIGSIKRLGPVAGLSDEQQTAADEAIEQVIDAFGELHDPMHAGEIPEDFDYLPIADELRSGLDALRAALPEEIAAKVKGIPEPPKAETPEPETPEADPVTEAPADAETPADAG